MTLVIAAGGTGGHVAPGLAVAKAWRKAAKDGEVLMVGSSRGVEARMAAAAGEDFSSVPAAPLRRPLWDPRNGLMPFVVLAGVISAMSLLKREKAVAVLATGGWVSVPLGIAAWIKGVPLVLHESNAWPGVATRLLARVAKRTCLGFKEAAGGLPNSKFQVTGNPSRFSQLPSRAAARKKFGFSGKGPVVLVMPGSGAAAVVNDMLWMWITKYAKKMPTVQILWMTGREKFDFWKQAIGKTKLNIKLFKFIEDVASAYSAADLVVCRAGSATLSELAAAGKASLIVPYPFATGGHQTLNAKAFEAAGAAVVEEQANLLSGFSDKMTKLLKSPAKLKVMGKKAKKMTDKKAAVNIVSVITEYLKKDES